MQQEKYKIQNTKQGQGQEGAGVNFSSAVSVNKSQQIQKVSGTRI